MALDTYNDLKIAIAGWLDRDDLAGNIDDFIDLAEDQHKRDIRFREILTRGVLTINQSDRYIDLPADFNDAKFIRVLTPAGSGGRRFFPNLEQLNLNDLTDRSINESCRPSAYTIDVQIEFDSEADQDYTGDFFYYTTMTPLSDGNQTNELLAKASDCYLYAALSASAPFLMNDERVPLWQTLYTNAKDSLNLSEIKNKHGGPLVARVQNIPPSVANW